MRAAARVLGLVLTGALFAEQPGLGKSPQVFRASINTVTVDVSVFEGSTPVVGLSASDFLLWDNDVRQLANVVSAGAIPLDVTLLLETTAITPARVAAFNARMQKMVEQLRSTDRVRLLTIDSYVDELVPIGPPALPMRPAKAGGSAASVYDALALSLMRRSEPGRRHLIVAFTREYDLRSAATAAMVIEIAKRSDAVLHIVEIDRDELPIGRTVESRFRPDVNGRASLVTAAETTGGAFHERAVFRDRMVDAFVKILTEFGQGYVLQFNLNGVARPGLHTIRVEVPSRRKVTVRARRTYVIEEPARGR